MGVMAISILCTYVFLSNKVLIISCNDILVISYYHYFVYHIILWNERLKDSKTFINVTAFLLLYYFFYLFQHFSSMTIIFRIIRLNVLWHRFLLCVAIGWNLSDQITTRIDNWISRRKNTAQHLMIFLQGFAKKDS